MNKRLRLTPLSLLLALALTGCDQQAKLTPEQQSGADPHLPAVQHFLLPPMQVPKAAGWGTDAGPRVADGLKIEKIADGLQHPRQIYVLPDNDILVVESNSPGTEAVTTPKQLIASLVQNQSGKGAKGGNRITLLRQTAHGWEKHLFLQHLNSPFGVQLIGNTLYVANAGNIMRYPYQTGATEITDPGTELADLPDRINHHWTKSLLASPDGKRLYVGVGSDSNITENGTEAEYRRADILEVFTDTGASRIFASGIRNPTGLQWQPESGELWAIANERDEIGADLVPDYLTRVQQGGFYGWPYSYYGQHIDPRVKPQRPDRVAKAIKPDYALGSHVAPLGLWFYTGQSLPEKYHGGAFISEHGSWDRSPLSGYQVSYVAFRQGQPVGKPEPVVTGFYSDDQKKLYGAPVGLMQDKEGALIIADDVGNAVWRVTAR